MYLKLKCLWISFTHILHSHSLSSAAAATTPLLATVDDHKIDVLDMKMSDDIFGGSLFDILIMNMISY